MFQVLPRRTHNIIIIYSETKRKFQSLLLPPPLHTKLSLQQSAGLAFRQGRCRQDANDTSLKVLQLKVQCGLKSHLSNLTSPKSQNKTIITSTSTTVIRDDLVEIFFFHQKERIASTERWNCSVLLFIRDCWRVERRANNGIMSCPLLTAGDWQPAPPSSVKKYSAPHVVQLFLPTRSKWTMTHMRADHDVTADISSIRRITFTNTNTQTHLINRTSRI